MNDMDMVEITYKLPSGKRVRLVVEVKVKEVLEESDRQLRNQRRRDRRHSAGYIDDWGDLVIAYQQESVEDQVIYAEAEEKLRLAIERLPKVQRRRMELYHYGGLTRHEISELEGVRYNTVVQSLLYAQKTLKSLLSR